VLAASPARADRCDDLAAQLKNQIDGLRVGQTAANLIYLAHPKAHEITLGCSGAIFPTSSLPRPTANHRRLHRSGRQRGGDHLHAAEGLHGDGREPLPQAMGLFRGDDVSIRYRRLDMRCSRTKTESSITSHAAGPVSERRSGAAARGRSFYGSRPRSLRQPFTIRRIGGESLNS